MAKNSSKQTGSAHVFIIGGIAVLIIGVLGFVFWQNFVKKAPANGGVGATSEQAAANTLPYRSEVIGIELAYPKEWIKLECDSMHIQNPQDVVYFGSNSQGLGIVDGNSILCGGGTDFPAQMQFKITDALSDEALAEYKKSAESVSDSMIDGKAAKKIVSISGADSIAGTGGLETTLYSIELDDGRAVEARYTRNPANTNNSLSNRDNSQATRDAFIKIVESSLRFL